MEWPSTNINAGAAANATAGSLGHPNTCKPCAFFCFGSGDCRRGAQCSFCHYEHKSKRREKQLLWKQKNKKTEQKNIGFLQQQAQGGYGPRNGPASSPLSPVKGGYGGGAPVAAAGSPQGRKMPYQVMPGASAKNPQDQDESCDGGGPWPSWGHPSVKPRSGHRPQRLDNTAFNQSDGASNRVAPRQSVPEQKLSSSKPETFVQELTEPSFAKSKTESREQFTGNITVGSIIGSPVSVAIGNPYLPDCPVIGISDGFSTLTGYTDEDIVGRNCRMLSEECDIPFAVRSKMRNSVASGVECVVVVLNKRKTGTFFHNMVYLCQIMVGHRRYMVGIQANEMTESGLHISVLPSFRRELQCIVDRIFDMHVDRWAERKLQDFCVNLPASYSRMLSTMDSEWFEQTKRSFAYSTQFSTEDRSVFCKNTFLDVDDEGECDSGEEFGFPRSISDPNLQLRQRRVNA